MIDKGCGNQFCNFHLCNQAFDHNGSLIISVNETSRLRGFRKGPFSFFLEKFLFSLVNILENFLVNISVSKGWSRVTFISEWN